MQIDKSIELYVSQSFPHLSAHLPTPTLSLPHKTLSITRGPQVPHSSPWDVPPQACVSLRLLPSAYPVIQEIYF